MLLFLIAILAPCLVLVALSLRMLEQERQLQERRAAQERQRRAAQLQQALLTRLERIKLDPAQSSEAVALVGRVREGRLLLPWDTNPNAQRFRHWTSQPSFAGKLRQAEREEFITGQLASAVQHYGQAIQAAQQPAAQACARLALARALGKMGRRKEARRQYQQVLDSPPELVDEHAVPLALYAAPPLLAAGLRGKEILRLVRTCAESREWLPPAALYMLRDLAAGDIAARLEEQIQEREQAEALQRDFSGLAPAFSSPEPVWVSYGEPRWLVSVAPGSGLAVAVRARQALARLGSTAAGVELARGKAGEPLGDNLPGLHVVIPDRVEEGGALRRSFPLLALALVVASTLFAGYLLWRDVRRELRLAETRSQFVSSVSHELKTPLTAIRMFTEAMRLDEDLDRETQCQYLDTILQESQRLSRLVDNVLDFAKLEQGKKIYEMRPTSLAEVVEAAARAMAYPLEQSGFQLEVTVDGDLPPLSADRDAIQQAVLNLLSNAMKYSGESRRIGLHLCRENGEAVIRVVDHGVGIPREEQARVFERFYRAPSPENQRLPGTGLGLTLAQHIARAHGGSVGVESHPGAGSTFTIRLPMGKAA